MRSATWAFPSSWRTNRNRFGASCHHRKKPLQVFLRRSLVYRFFKSFRPNGWTGLSSQILQFFDGTIEDIEVDILFFPFVTLKLSFIGVLAEQPGVAVR